MDACSTYVRICTNVPPHAEIHTQQWHEITARCEVEGCESAGAPYQTTSITAIRRPQLLTLYRLDQIPLSDAKKACILD